MLRNHQLNIKILAVPLFMLAAAGSAQATVTQVSSAGALGATDYFDWGQLLEGLTLASPAGVTSGILGDTGTISDGGSFTHLIEATDWFGNFTPGDNVLYTGDTNNPFGASSS